MSLYASSRYFKLDIYQWAINVYSIQGYDGKWGQSCFRNKDETWTSTNASGSVDMCSGHFYLFYFYLFYFIDVIFGCTGSSLLLTGFSLQWLLLCQSADSRLWASVVAAHSFSPQGMWDLPGPGMEPPSPALAGRFLSTVPPGKSHFYLSLLKE